MTTMPQPPERVRVWQVYVTNGPMSGTEFWCAIETTAKTISRKLRRRPDVSKSDVVVSEVWLEPSLANTLLRQHPSTTYAY